MSRKVRRLVNVVSGGEDTSSPMLSQPLRYSRLLQNFYIDSNGHVRKVPGYGAVSNSVNGLNVNNGLDFVKSDGTNKLLIGGEANGVSCLYTLENGVLTQVYDEFEQAGKVFLAQSGDRVLVSNGNDEPKVYDGTLPLTDLTKPYVVSDAVFTGTGLDDLVPVIDSVPDGFVSATVEIDSLAAESFETTYTTDFDELDDLSLLDGSAYTGSGTPTFEVKIDGEGDYDTVKYNYNGGIYNPGNRVRTITKENDDFDNDSLGDLEDASVFGTSSLSYSNGEVLVFPTNASYFGSFVGNYYDFGLKNSSSRATGSWEAKVRPINYYGKHMFVTLALVSQGDEVEVFPGITTYYNNIYKVQVDDNPTSGVATLSIVKTIGDISGGPLLLTGTTTLLAATTSYSSALKDTTNGYVLRLERDSNGALRAYVNGTLAISAVDTDITSFTHSLIGISVSGQFVSEAIGVGNIVAFSDIEFSDAGTDITVAQLAATSVTKHSKNDYYDFEIIQPQTTVLSPLSFKWSKNGGDETTVTCDYGSRKWITLDADWSISPTLLTGVSEGDTFRFQCDGANQPDTFKWRVDGGDWTEGVDISSGPMLLQDGIQIEFDYFTGHHADADGDTGDEWSFDVGSLADKVKTKVGDGAYGAAFALTGGTQEIDGAEGIKFFIPATTGHTIGDKWVISATEDNRLGKMHTYKGRVWSVYRTGMLAIHSALQDPTDFRTADDAGYLDFSTVLPKGDTMIDISSVLDTIVFFFSNHIAIYRGYDPTADGDFALQQVITDMGVVAEGVVVRVGNDIIFLTKMGVKSLRQVATTGSLNIESVSATIDGDIISAIESNSGGVYSSGHCQSLSLIMFQIGSTIFCYQYNKKAWSRIVIPSGASQVLTMFSDKDGTLYFGGEKNVFEFNADGVYNFNGTAPEYVWHSGYFQVSDSDMFFTDGVVRSATPASTASLSVQVNTIGEDVGQDAPSDLYSQDITFEARSNAIMNEAMFPMFGAGKWAQMRFTEAPEASENEDLSLTGFEIRGEIGEGN